MYFHHDAIFVQSHKFNDKSVAITKPVLAHTSQDFYKFIQKLFQVTPFNGFLH